MSYSNSGYVLLGFLVERVSGQSYADFVRDNIFKPLGMNDSATTSTPPSSPQRAAGYTPAERLVNAPYMDMTVPHGAGALYSTTEDLMRWTQGLFGGQLLSAESLAKMTTPFKSDYAFGVIVSTAGGRKSVEHGGGIEGSTRQLTYYPDSKVTVAVLANVNGHAATQLAGQLGPSRTATRSAWRPSERDRAAAREARAPRRRLRVRSDGDDAHHRRRHAAPQPARSAARGAAVRGDRDAFFPRVVEAELTSSSTRPARRRRACCARTARGGRRASRSAPRSRCRSTCSSVIPARIGFTAVRPRDHARDGQLMSQATGQGKAPLFAEAEDPFFLKVANAQIEFVNAGGRVTALC